MLAQFRFQELWNEYLIHVRYSTSDIHTHMCTHKHTHTHPPNYYDKTFNFFSFGFF